MMTSHLLSITQKNARTHDTVGMLEKSTVVLETWLQLGALDALVKGLGLIPSSNMATHNCLRFQFQGIF